MHVDPHAPSRARQGSYNRGPGADIERDRDRLREFLLEASNGDFDGPAWRVIRNDAWVTGARVVASMIRTDRVWGRYRQLRQIAAHDLRTPAVGISRDDAYHLACDSVERALPLLRRQLLEGKWDPDRDNPASINTWFVNLAVLCLPGPWRVWRRQRRAQLVSLDPDHEVIDLRDQPDAVIYTIEFERHLEFFDPELASMVRLDAAEWEDAEIAAAVGRSVKSVEYHLAKARWAARDRRSRENLRDHGTGAA